MTRTNTNAKGIGYLVFALLIISLQGIVMAFYRSFVYLAAAIIIAPLVILAGEIPARIRASLSYSVPGPCQPCWMGSSWPV